MADPAALEREPLRPLVWAAAAFAAGVVLHLDRVPPWVPVAALLLVAWRLAAAARPIGLPRSAVRTLLAVALIGAVFARFRTLNGLSAGTALLILMSAVKLLETRRQRDQYVVVGAGLFLLLAACLDRQSLARAPLYLLHTWLCCSALAVVAYASRTPAAVAASGSLDTRTALHLAARTLLLAMPLALALFLFFPRLPGAFWALPRSEEALTGLGDTMSPGSIAQLTASYEIAFRVKFAGAPPPPQERYWRGPVLHRFDGSTWSREPDLYPRQRLQGLGPAYSYRVALEPSQQRWWFSLDTPDRAPDPKVVLTDDYQLIANDPVAQPTSYDALSHTRTRSTEPLSALSRRRDTALPPRNPRSLDLAHELRERAGSDTAFVQAALEFLGTGGFVYSLTPPRLGYDSVDDFLFNTRSGFCGHYASAFVTLMRAGGVPARVVTGYLGGEWNPIGGYFVVRQSDAHAWAEVWLQDRGWTRVDPTGVVEPERLQRGILDLLPEALSAPMRLVRSSAWLTDWLQRWDALNAWWNDQVVRFDYQTQLDLLTSLGINTPDLRHLGWAFVLALLGWLGWIAWHVGRSAPGPRPDRLARAYTRLGRKLARIGLPRAAHQGPLAYADAVAERRPDLGQTVGSLLRQYAELRYGLTASELQAAQVGGFERAVAHMSVSRAP